ncbi:BtrH N-terminal domain-containing protein, partial [bacterium]|nr:BtrH N-terminal domain-containing protein [bacterium]
MKTSKISALVLIIGLIFSGYSCDRGITVDLDDEKIELKGFEAVEGKHCESTAIMNALNYQGVPLNEAMINGFAGSISFAFITEGGFPFLGGRTMTFL